MVALEWQAELNWYAYCAEGRDHKRISDQEISEMVNRPGVMTMPHFQSAVERGGQLRTDGFWSYYTQPSLEGPVAPVAAVRSRRAGPAWR